MSLNPSVKIMGRGEGVLPGHVPRLRRELTCALSAFPLQYSVVELQVSGSTSSPGSCGDKLKVVTIPTAAQSF